MRVSSRKHILVACSALLCALFLTNRALRPTADTNSEISENIELDIPRTNIASGRASAKVDQPCGLKTDAFETTVESSLADHMRYILADAHIGSDRYRLLVDLLESHEYGVLKFLSERRYPNELSVHDAAHREIEMITRAMLEFYRRQPLNENLEKMALIRNTGPLFSSIVTDLLFASEGAPATQVAYDWVISNPQEPAALRSGATVGGMLMEHSPNEAWSKAIDLPQGVIRARAFSTILTVAAHEDVNVAIGYINSIEETSDLDPAISHVLTQALHADYAYDQLIDIAIAPIDPTYRLSSLTILFNEWAAKKPDSLVQWLKDSHDYPAAEQLEMKMVAKQTLHGHLVDFESP